MNRYNKRINKALSLGAALLATLVLACGCVQRPGGTDSLAPAAPPPQPQSQPQQEEEYSDIVFYLPAEQTALAGIVTTVAQAEGVGITIKSPPRGAQYEASLAEILESASPPDLFYAADLNTVAALEPERFHNMMGEGGQVFAALAGMSPLKQAALKGEALVGLPVGTYAEGYLTDLGLLAELLNTTDKQALQRNIIGCSWDEWQILVMMLEDYLQRPRGMTITLSGVRYTTAGFRPQSARQLRGVFAVADGDNGAALLQQLAASTVGLGYTDYAAMNADTAEYRALILQPAFRALFGLLDLETIYMARTGPAVYRGATYDSETGLSAAQALEQFKNGNALFYRSDSQTGARLLEEDPTLADRLFMVPTKLPPPQADEEAETANSAASSEVADPDEEARAEIVRQLDEAVADILAKNNTRLWYGSGGYLCISAGSGAKRSAEAVLLRLYTTEEGRGAIWTELQLQPFTEVYPQGLLRNQLQTTAANDEGNLLPGPDSALAQQAALVGGYVQQELLLLEEWSLQEEAAFVNRCLYAFGLPENPVEEEAQS